MQATETIEGYDSFEQIAVGGMAAVYKARKISLHKPVAIKVLFPHLARDTVFLERFKREAKTAASVQHDNIVNVVDYGESGGSHYIVMEYYDGVTLELLLEQQSSIPLDICFAILLNVCYGLEAAHAANLVHRDVKPANVILTRSGGVKIADFGLARPVDKPAGVTRHGKIVGTPAYMSPEQTRGDEIGTQSDIFSLGVVAYELICNCRPFEGRNYAEVVSAIQSEVAVPVRQINPLVTNHFVDIIDRMLAKDTQDRYQEVSEVVSDLEEVVEKSGYRRDRRMLTGYIADPGEYLQSFRRQLLERLRNSAPSSLDDPEQSAAHCRQILFLEPGDRQAREQLKKLKADDIHRPGATSGAGSAPGQGWDELAKKGLDPDAEYRVFLESVDPSRETPSTFALKLSMRVRSPLPRVMSIVKYMPSLVAGHLSLERATQLTNVIEKLGGIARMEAHPTQAAGGEGRSDSPAPQGGGRRETNQGPAPGSGERRVGVSNKTIEHHPINVQRTNVDTKDSTSNEIRTAGGPPSDRSATRVCPKCGWEQSPDAKFCSVCHRNFHKTEPVDLRDYRSQDIDNPLTGRIKAETRFNLSDLIRRLPKSIKYGGLACLIILLLLIVFGR